MEQSFIVGFVALTSLGAYLIGSTRLGLSARSLGPAIGRMLESIGMALIFLIANLLSALTVVLLLRALNGWFVSIYFINDIAWFALSLVQGLTFQRWWESRRGAGVPS